MEAEEQVTSSQGGTSAASDGALAGSSTSKGRAEFEGLLALAEALQKSFDTHSDVYRKSSFTQLGSVLLVCSSLASGLSLITSARSVVPHSSFLPPLVLIVLGVICLFVVPIAGQYAYLQWRDSKQAKRAWREDERNLTEVVELLREIEPVLAREQNFSAFERIQIRIRLSRFGVGSSSQGDAGVLSRTLAEDVRSRKSRADQELAKPLR